jgi:hypothetical protein
MNRLCSAVILLALSAGTARAAERIALLPVSGTNIHQGYLEAAQDVFKDHLMATGHYFTVVVAGQPGTTELDGEQAVARAREVHADLAAVVHVTRLAGTGRVRLLVYRVATGALAYSDSVSVSGGPDDLDPALKRLAVGLATGKPASQTADIESVTQRQSEALLKESATRSFGLRVGTMVPLNRPGGNAPSVLGSVGIFWLYDARSYLAEVAVDLGLGDAGTSFSAGVGGYYPFRRTNFTPYVGGMVAFSAANFGGDGASGIRLHPAAGVLFGRLSTVQLRAELGYFINTFGERDRISYEVPVGAVASGSRRYAHGPTLAFGIGF